MKLKVVSVYGGLGNQIHCLLFALALRDQGYGVKFLDVSAYKGNHDNFGRVFELGDLVNALGFRVVGKSRLSAMILRLLFKCIQIILPKAIIKEDGPEYQKKYLSESWIYMGYWQSSLYLTHINDINKMYSRFLLEYDVVEQTIQESHCQHTLIHYRNFNTDAVGINLVTNDDYFCTAVDREIQKGVNTFCILSHDATGADRLKNKLVNLFDNIEISVCASQSPISDYCSLLKAKRVICAISTFSTSACLISSKEVFYVPNIKRYDLPVWGYNSQFAGVKNIEFI